MLYFYTSLYHRSLQSIFLIKKTTLSDTFSSSHSSLVLTYDIKAFSVIEKRDSSSSSWKYPIRRFQRFDSTRKKVAQSARKILSTIRWARIRRRPGVLPPRFPFSVQRLLGVFDRDSHSGPCIDRKRGIRTFGGGCVSHTGWSKSHAIRIPIAVSIQFARHFGHPV